MGFSISTLLGIGQCKRLWTASAAGSTTLVPNAPAAGREWLLFFFVDGHHITRSLELARRSKPGKSTASMAIRAEPGYAKAHFVLLSSRLPAANMTTSKHPEHFPSLAHDAPSTR